MRRICIWILGLKGSSVNIVVGDWYQLANLFVNSCCDTCKLVIVTRAPSQAKPGFYELVLAEARGTQQFVSGISVLSIILMLYSRRYPVHLTFQGEAAKLSYLSSFLLFVKF